LERSFLQVEKPTQHDIDMIKAGRFLCTTT